MGLFDSRARRRDVTQAKSGVDVAEQSMAIQGQTAERALDQQRKFLPGFSEGADLLTNRFLDRLRTPGSTAQPMIGQALDFMRAGQAGRGQFGPSADIESAARFSEMTRTAENEDLMMGQGFLSSPLARRFLDITNIGAGAAMPMVQGQMNAQTDISNQAQAAKQSERNERDATVAKFIGSVGGAMVGGPAGAQVGSQAAGAAMPGAVNPVMTGAPSAADQAVMAAKGTSMPAGTGAPTPQQQQQSLLMKFFAGMFGGMQ